MPPLPSSWTCPRVLKIRPGKEAYPDFARTEHLPQDQGLALKALNLPSVQDRGPLDKTGEKPNPARERPRAGFIGAGGRIRTGGLPLTRRLLYR